MIQVIKANGTTYGPGLIQIIDKYGKPKTPFVPIVWGTITGTLSAQTDLQNALNLKEDKINKGLPNGYASLNGAGLVPSSQLPSYVDDIVEVANYAALPIPGETGKIYVTLDTNEVYRWSGSVYIEIAANPAVWGTITGTVTAQTDLTSYISSNYYPLVTNPAGYITSAALAPYLTSATAASTYYPLTNPSGYITASALTPYLTTASAALTYYPIPTGTTSQYIRGDGSVATFPTSLVTGSGIATRIAFWDTTSSLSSNSNLYWDNVNNRLGIGNASPIASIDLGSSTGSAGTINKLALYSSVYGTYGFGVSPAQLDYVSGGAHVFYKNSPSISELFRIDTSGNLTSSSLIGSGTRMLITDSLGLISSQAIPTIPVVTPSALTKTDDTNVTLTLGGSPSTALLAATSITVGWTGTLADSRIASASTWNAKQNALSGTGFVKSTAGVISYDTNTYLTTADAASTYYPLTNPAGYITASSLTGYVPYTGATADLNLGTYNLKVGNGTVSNNSIQIGAANVGLFSPSANRIDFVTNGVARMAIISNGNVVMGNTTTSVIGNSYLDYVTNQTGLKLSATALNLAVTGSNLLNIFGVTTTGNTTSFSLTKPNNTGQTATFSISGWTYNGGSRQWNTGNIGTQNENVWGSVTYDFVGASVVDTAYGNVFNAATAGTNATISNNYAGHFIGNIFLSGGNRIIKSSNGLILEGASGSPTTLRAGGGGSINLAFLNEVSYLTIYGYQSTGANTTFNFTKPNNIGQTASTAVPGWNYAGGSRTWLVGNIAAQNENIWGAVTYNFGAASVIAKAIGNVFNAPIAGTNTTITANFAAQFNGNVEMVGAMTSLYYMSVSNPNAVATASAKFQVTNAAGNTSQFSIASNSDAVDPSLLSIGGSNKGVEFSSNSVRALKILDGSRNVTIQNGGTVTDNGYRLEVFGTTNVVGTTSTDAVVFGPEQAVTGTGANWTGTGYTTGYTHTPGSVDPLVSSFIPGAGAYMQISYTVTGRTAGSINITFVTYVLNGFNTNASATSSFRANGSGPGFTITPTTDFNGTIVVSVKYVSTAIAALATYKTSTGISNLEIRTNTANWNTFIGANVGRYNTTGVANTVIGYNAMPNVMTGGNNTSIGYTAGVTNTAGTNNTYLGSGAGYINAIGGNNVCLGTAAGYGSTGNNNIFIGVSAGNSTSTGSNTAIGTNALYTNTTGGNNNVIGFGSLQSNTTGSFNDGIGRDSGFANTTGSGNQFFGYNAGRYIANGSTANTITNNSIFIGAVTKPLADNQTNQIVIGYGSTGIGSNTTVLGNSSTVTTAIYGNLMLGTTTASTYKLDVQGTANILTSLNLGNYATPTAQRIFTVGQDTAFITMGSIPSVTGNAGIWLNQPTPSAYNVSVRVDLNNLWINAPGAGGSILLTTGGTSTPVRMYGALNTSSVASYVWTKPTYLNGTASTAIPGWSYDGTTRQWLTGNITTQNENVWGATTYSFVGASTIATAFGNVFNKAVAGTNCTITSNYSAQFNGNIQIAGGDIHFSNQNWVIGGLPATSGIITYNGGVGYSFTTGSNATTDFKWQTGYTDRLRLFGATGNMLIQNGGTLTDAGYKLDVQGTVRVTGSSTAYGKSMIVQSGTNSVDFGQWDANNTGIWMDATATARTSSNYTLLGGGGQTYLNAASGGAVNIRIANADLIRVVAGNITFGSFNQNLVFTPTANSPTLVQTGATSSVIRANAGTRSLLLENYASDQNYLTSYGAVFRIRTGDANNLQFYTNNVGRLTIPSTGGLQFTEANDIFFGTTTGTKIGGATNQKLAFWNTVPIVQPANTVSLNGVLENTGLMASGSTISTIDKPLVVGTNTTPRTGVATDGVTSVLGDLQNFTTEYHSGEVLYNEVSGEPLSFGQLCWRDRFGKWQLALGNVAGESAYNMLGICLHTVGAADTAISILTRGYVETTYISATNTGSPLYMSAATAGGITDIFPAAAGNIVRLIGNVFWDAASQTNGKWIIYFNPDNTWLEL